MQFASCTPLVRRNQFAGELPPDAHHLIFVETSRRRDRDYRYRDAARRCAAGRSLSKGTPVIRESISPRPKRSGGLPDPDTEGRVGVPPNGHARSDGRLGPRAPTVYDWSAICASHVVGVSRRKRKPGDTSVRKTSISRNEADLGWRAGICSEPGAGAFGNPGPASPAYILQAGRQRGLSLSSSASPTRTTRTKVLCVPSEPEPRPVLLCDQDWKSTHQSEIILLSSPLPLPAFRERMPLPC